MLLLRMQVKPRERTGVIFLTIRKAQKSFGELKISFDSAVNLVAKITSLSTGSLERRETKAIDLRSNLPFDVIGRLT